MLSFGQTDQIGPNWPLSTKLCTNYRLTNSINSNPIVGEPVNTSGLTNELRWLQLLLLSSTSLSGSCPVESVGNLTK